MLPLFDAHIIMPPMPMPPMLMAYAASATTAPHRFPYVLGEAFEPQGHLVQGSDASAGVLPPSPRLQSFLHLRQRDHTNE